ncbi:hypothetical protein L211DRAFT_846088 [Terfezia boudieri ATCC MYA-4762]|uniref:Uncharacterized protein n=1 Tax=Terfezia boudieri ATCC MYA-4762 TaxID=1051890 RepID=A0A3N4LZ64_9PEZI|nr:hypothetical protein L211DRAFT_846088 [Terfezia boudieri ATCC MYA-4762]
MTTIRAPDEVFEARPDLYYRHQATVARLIQLRTDCVAWQSKIRSCERSLGTEVNGLPITADGKEAIIARYRGELERVKLRRLAFEEKQKEILKEWEEWLIFEERRRSRKSEERHLHRRRQPQIYGCY